MLTALLFAPNKDTAIVLMGSEKKNATKVVECDGDRINWALRLRMNSK